MGEKKNSKPLVSIVSTFLNEENVLPELLTRLRNVLTKEQKSGNIGGYELILVNDASTDGSEKLLRSEIMMHKDIVLINMARKFGHSECAMAGLEHSKGDVVVYLDADLQDPPEIIPQLIETWKNDPEVEVVYTTRKSREGEHPIKLWLTNVGYRIIKIISDIDLPVNSGDFKLLSRRVVTEIIKLKEKRPYFRGLASWVGFKQAQVFYDRDPRFDGRENSKSPVLGKRVIYYFLDVALISFSDAPLKASLFLGLTISTLALFYIFVVLLQKITGRHDPGWPALMTAILLLGGIQLTVLGVIGLYLSTIFWEAKGRPNYIIKNVVSP